MPHQNVKRNIIRIWPACCYFSRNSEAKHASSRHVRVVSLGYIMDKKCKLAPKLKLNLLEKCISQFRALIYLFLVSFSYLSQHVTTVPSHVCGCTLSVMRCAPKPFQGYITHLPHRKTYACNLCVNCLLPPKMSDHLLPPPTLLQTPPSL